MSDVMTLERIRIVVPKQRANSARRMSLGNSRRRLGVSDQIIRWQNFWGAWVESSSPPILPRIVGDRPMVDPLDLEKLVSMRGLAASLE
jgi:hypothetical protein